MVNVDADFSEEDYVMTLSTCTEDASTKFVVHGVLIDEYTAARS